MSSNEEDYNDDDSSSALKSMKKRRIQRACDICRRKKIRCDGVQMPGKRCSNCISCSYECTYVETAKKRGPPKGYVEALETRLEKLDKLLRRLCPDNNFLKELDENLERDSSWLDRISPLAHSNLLSAAGPSGSGSGSSSTNHNRNHNHHSNNYPSSSSSAHLPSLTNPPGAGGSIELATSMIRRVTTKEDEKDIKLLYPEDEKSHVILADNLQRLSLEHPPKDYRFFGKSSGAMLIQTAIELKNEYTGSESDLLKQSSILGSKRPEFWTLRPWERDLQETPKQKYTFPPSDLLHSLTSLYFQHVNLHLPLLHRPTFERNLAENLQNENEGFGSVVLLVCAVGARYSTDERVLLDGEESYHSCGWKWFDQVQVVKNSLMAPPTLYDLQFYCLAVQFLQGSSAPQACWTMVGIGIRLAQDVGAHRRKVLNRPMTVEDELWRRVFWVLVCMDRMVSAALGRPCAIHEEDFDVDLPTECDDEYWEHPDKEQRFIQPKGKPSLVSAFVLYIRLNQILVFTLRTIYTINKSKILLGFIGQQWEQHIVAELDSSLNKWVDSVPDHLRWDPTRENDDFFNQSVVLYASYYHIQILIHRPFIPSPSKPSPLSFPSLAICTNAARSCSHVVDIQRKRNEMPPPQIQMPVFTSGIVLLLSIWGGKRSGLTTDPKKEMADVHKCMQILRSLEQRWHSAGRLWDILYELASVGDLPLPQPSPPSTNKRERDSESSRSSDTSPVPMSTTRDGPPRNIAGLRRTHKEPSQSQPMASSSSSHSQPSTQAPTPSHPPPQPLPPQMPQEFALPVYSEELGRLPLHGSHVPPQDGYWYHPPAQMSTNNRFTGVGGMGNMDPAPPVYPIHSSLMNYDQHMPLGYTTPSEGYQDLIPPAGRYTAAAGPSNMHAFAQPQRQQQQLYVDSDAMAMWSNAPTGFELNEWGSYLNSVSEITQGHPTNHGGHMHNGS